MNDRILFIGNSYTYYNGGVPELFEQIAISRGITPIIRSVTRGGYFLEQYLDPKDEAGALVQAELTGKNCYHYVILQEQSVCPAATPAKFYTSARRFDRMIREQGGKTVFYQTWGRKPGHAILQEHGWTNETMTYCLAAAYEAISDELGAMLAPVGSAYYRINADFPDVELYAQDRTHPSVAGSYLSALCLFATVYRKTPTGTVFMPEGMTRATAELLQYAARQAVFGVSILPPEYQTSSVGIGKQ